MAETSTTLSEEELSCSSSNIDNNSTESTSDVGEKSEDTKPTSGNPSLEESCRLMFKHISEYLQCELNVSLEDYSLLEKLNQLTKQKYVEMDNVTKSLIARMGEINEKYEKLKPYLDMVDKVDASVTNLEDAAHKLDNYSKELEARFKKLEKAAS